MSSFLTNIFSSDGNQPHFENRRSLYQHRLMIDHLWQLPPKCILFLGLLKISNSPILRVWLIKVKSWLKLYPMITQTTKYFICSCCQWFSNKLTRTIHIVTNLRTHRVGKTFLLNRTWISYNFLSFIQD